MPIYKFNCSNCDASIEKIMKFSEMDNEVICSDCKAKMIRQTVNKTTWVPGKTFFTKGFTHGKS